MVELPQQVGQPYGAELGDEHVDLREPTEEVVEHHRGERLHDRPVPPVRDPLETVEVLVARLRVFAPVRSVLRVATTEVHGDPRFRLVDEGPEAVEVWVERRPSERGPRGQVNHARPSVEGALQLRHRMIGVEQGHRDRDDDPVGVRITPVFEQPVVVCTVDGIARFDVAPLESALPTRAYGVQHRHFDILGVHEGQTGILLLEGGTHRVVLLDELGPTQLVQVAHRVELVEHCPRDRDSTLHLGNAAQIDPPVAPLGLRVHADRAPIVLDLFVFVVLVSEHAWLPGEPRPIDHLRVEVARNRISRRIEMVIGIEDAIRKALLRLGGVDPTGSDLCASRHQSPPRNGPMKLRATRFTSPS